MSSGPTSPKIANRISVAKTAVVCKSVTVKGNVSIGANTIIHPKCVIYALGGPIQIGSNCILEEHVQIINEPRSGNNGEEVKMVIGNHNHFEVGSIIKAKTMGNANVVEPRAKLGTGSTIGNGCIIGTSVQVEKGADVPNERVLWGNEQRWRDNPEGEQTNLVNIKPKLAMLRVVLPKSHRLLGAKTNK